MPVTVAMTLDLRGPTLALTVARTAVAMTRLRPGELLEVLTSDPDEARDLSVWARATRHRSSSRPRTTASTDSSWRSGTGEGSGVAP